MKIMIIGGAGLMGRIAALDLQESPAVEQLVIADYQADKAEELAASFNDPRITSRFVDATDIEAMAGVIGNCDAVINSTVAALNVNVMRACLKAGCHYNDLGGLFHNTLKQLKLDEDFRKAGLSAVVCMGSAPGITNIMARYAYDRLDSVETVNCFVASTDLAEAEGPEFFIPPYAIRTVMEEYGDESRQFIDGEYRTMPALSGEMEMVFPEPVGKAVCHHTLHSEPATIPKSFKDKGVKTVTWRLSLPDKFEAKAAFLADLGFSSPEPLEVKGAEVAPPDFLEAIIERYLETKIKKQGIKSRRLSCVRSQVIGEKDGRRVEYILDCPNKPHSRWGVMCGTSVPPSIAAQMQVLGRVAGPGVLAPEQAFDPEEFFTELAKRELVINVTRKVALG